MNNKITVLIIDQGISFGGSMVVISNLVRCLDKSQFRAVIVGEMDRSIIEGHVKDCAKIYIVRHLFNYAHWHYVTSRLLRLRSKIISKAGIYLFSMLRTAVNVIYGIRLALIVLRERVDIIHINNGSDNIEANVVSLLLGRKRLIHVHGAGGLSQRERFFLKFVPKIIAISEYIRGAMLELAIPDDKIVVIPNPVLTEPLPVDARERMRNKYGITPEDKVFGIFGRVVAWKGQMEFLRAAALVLENTQNTFALIVGDTSDGGQGYLNELQRFVVERGIQDRVIFTGYIAEVAEMYVAMDVVVHASIEPEPFGLVVTEAMSYGVPVIASTLGAPQEIIQDKYNGFLVHPGNTVELAETISRLLQDDELRRTIGVRGREHVLEAFDAERYARRVEALYRDVLSV